jgi:cytochrome c oxidase cbb3-type subunit 3
MRLAPAARLAAASGWASERTGHRMLTATLIAASVITLFGASGCRPEGQEQLRAAERGPTDSTPAGVTAVSGAAGVDPGIHPSVLLGDLHNPYAGDAAAAAEGRQLFVSYNCSGCHGGRAGGGMGPSLRDELWIYGGSDVQVYASIFEGRPNGMPTWGSTLSADQIWKLVTYIRTLNTPGEPDPPPPQDHPPLLPSDG